MDALSMLLQCVGPYSFFETTDVPCAQSSEHAASKGVYLWTLPLGDTYRVNYVGKTSNRAGFGQRFRQEILFAKNGKRDRGKVIRAPLVDCQRWFSGDRVVTSRCPSADENAVAWPEMERTYCATRVFLITVDGDDATRTRVETTIGRHLWETCDLCRHFMCPPMRRRPPTDAPRLLLDLRLPVGVKICGVDGLIPEKEWAK